MLRYKACENSIVTLELLNNSVTNEKRDGVVDDRYAKFRCNEAKVINITNVKTGEKINSDVSIRDKNFVYTLGKVIKTNFDKTLKKVCTEGIHYFKTKEAAVVWFYCQIGENFPDGEWIIWRGNGKKKSKGTYKNGYMDGKRTDYFKDGNKLFEGTYKDGKEDGKWIWWWNNGQKNTDEIWKNGKKDGKYIDRWYSGNKKSEGTYKDNEKYGKWIEWNDNGTKYSERTYKNGELIKIVLI